MMAYVTGIAGFLGSAVARNLMFRNWTVLGCDNFLTGDPDNVPDGCILFYDDIRSGISVPADCDVVVHTAAIARSAWPSESEIVDVNVAGTQRVIEAGLKTGTRMVYASSCVSHVPGANTYARSKWVAEQDVLAANGVALRYSNIYGPGQSSSGPEPNVLAAWNKQKLTGPIRVDGDGSQRRDFLHISDAVAATILACLSPLGDGSWFDVCTGVQTPLLEVAAAFDHDIHFAHRRPGDPDEIPQDPNPAEKTFGFKAKVPLAKGLKDVLQ